jgi:WD40 repeat protein
MGASGMYRTLTMIAIGALGLAGRCGAQQAPQLSGAQTGCAAPMIPAPEAKSDMFTARQEMDLGDAIAEQVQREYLVIDDEDVTANVRRIGERLLAQAPATDLKIQFFLFDLPIANALTLPGGRIYVSRKLIALTRNEDELASVLGHELGHALTHQPAMDTTQLWREVLGVQRAGSREEIFRSYELLQESVVRKRKAFARASGEEKQEQFIADQVGLQLITKAGYAPQAFPDFFDRLAETKGKTGSWLSDLFGSTRPDARRLREMQKQVAAVTTACKTAATATVNSAAFKSWQAAVVSYTGLGHKEQLHGVFGKAKLNPPLQSDIRYLRFSPDGKYLLAQDESTIYVMTREPLAAKFTIYAPDAYAAKFTADSQSIVFYTGTLRVETWSVPEEARATTTEMVISSGCMQSELSPDAKFLACYGPEFDLAVYEVETGEQKFLKKNFSAPRTFLQYYAMLFARLLDSEDFEFVHMHFSPDGRYFVAHGAEDDSNVALDLNGFHAFSLPGAVRELMWGSFTFVGADKIAGTNRINPKNSALAKFPSGEVIRKIQFGNSHLEAASDGRHVMVYPILNHPLGVMDLETGAIVLGSDNRAFDADGTTYAHERIDGDIGINGFPAAKELFRVKLPIGQLGYLRAASLSPDLRWLAISERSRGGLWDLLSGQRVFYTHGFNGALVSPQGVVDADFAKFKDSKRQMARMDPVRRSINQGREIGDEEVWQFGKVLLRTTRKGKNEWKLRNLSVEALDVTNDRTLWTRDFPKEAPRFLSSRIEGNLVFSWPANSDGAKLEIKSDPGLSHRWPRLDAGLDDYFLEVVDPSSGKILGSALVRTGKRAFQLESAESSGDWLVAADSTNRLLVYSLASGEQTGILFGRRPVISPGTSMLAAENERGQLSLYDLKTLLRKEQYYFTSPLAYTYFAPDNRRIFVLTDDQTAYFLAMPKVESAKVQ